MLVGDSFNRALEVRQGHVALDQVFFRQIKGLDLFGALTDIVALIKDDDRIS